MSKTKVILIVAYLLAMAAGVLVGMNIDRRRPTRQSELSRRLNLTDAQRDQMRKIWSSLAPQPGQRGGGYFELARKRDEAVVALLTPEQRQRYNAIHKDFADALSQQAEARRAAFEQAVEETKQLLTPEQAAQYEEMMRQRDPRRHSGAERFDARRRGPASRPASGTTEDSPDVER